MDEIARTILSAKRRRFLRSQPVFEPHSPVTEAELFHLARGMNFKFSLGLSKWLRMAGYGDIDGALSFREEFFFIITEGMLSGCVIFAHDSVGNRYAFDPKSDSVYFISAIKQASAQISSDFTSFLQELIRRDYHLAEWVNGLPA